MARNRHTRSASPYSLRTARCGLRWAVVCIALLVCSPVSVALAAPPTATFVYTAAATAPVGFAPAADDAGDLNGDGKKDLVVTNLNDDTVSVLLGNGGMAFTPAPGSPIPVGLSPNDVVLADLNNDGKLDFVVANFDANTVSIFLGVGNGTFTQAAGSPVTVGTNPTALVVADFGNGHKDIAVANYGSNNVTILLGNGTGVFAPAPGSPIAVGTSPIGIVAADLNQANGADLAVLNRDSDTVTILISSSTGNGTFVIGPGSPFNPGVSLPSAIAVGAVNTNTNTTPSIVVTSYFASNNLAVLLGDGHGAFAPAPSSPATLAHALNNFTLVDVNGDNKPDIIGTDTVVSGDSHMDILLGNGNGTFTQPTGGSYQIGVNPGGIVVADLNGDTRMDVAIANQSDNTLSLFTGNGTGAFTLASPAPLVTKPCVAAASDVNGDGRPDIVASVCDSPTISVLLDNANGTFTAAPNSPIPIPPGGIGSNGAFDIAIADVSGDSKPDIIFANRADNHVGVLLGGGNGTFTLVASTTNVGTFPSCLRVADLNHDGKADLVVTDSSSGTIGIFLSNGNGTFTQTGSPISLGSGSIPGCATIMDVNNDTFPDIAVADDHTDTVNVLLGNGAGGFSLAPGAPLPIPTTFPGDSIGDPTLHDLNGDGKPDLVEAADGKVNVFLGTGTGTFTAASGSPIIVGGSTRATEIGDLNGDGIPDIVVADSANNLVEILLGNGNGTFVDDPASPFPVGAGPVGVVIGDLNGDGKADIITLPQGLGNLGILLNTTSGAPASLPIPKPPGPVNPTKPNPLPIPPQPTGSINPTKPNPLPSPRP